MLWIFWIIVEIMLFSRLGDLHGYGRVTLAYLAPSLLGFFVLSFQARKTMSRMQQRMNPDLAAQTEAAEVFTGMLVGMLLVVPMMAPRVLALILIFPLTRRLMMKAIQGWLMKKMAQGNLRVFTGGFGMGAGWPPGGPGAMGGMGSMGNREWPRGAGGPTEFDPVQAPERDATIIDIKKIE